MLSPKKVENFFYFQGGTGEVRIQWYLMHIIALRYPGPRAPEHAWLIFVENLQEKSRKAYSEWFFIAIFVAPYS